MIFFVLGITLGSGPCLASCGPLLISYCVGTRRNIPGAINAYLIFSLSKILAYLALGVSTFFVGRFIFDNFPNLYRIIQVCGGIFIVIMGALMLTGKSLAGGPCTFLHNHLLGENKKSMLILGLLIGFLPCAPLFSVFTYSTLVSITWHQAFLYSFAFGLGTIISPLSILVIFAGLMARVINKEREISIRVMGVVCGLILVFLGAQLIQRALSV